MNSTDEYWTIDGVSLHQHGWSVQTVGGTRYAVPPMRGANTVAAGVPGEFWLPKVVDKRVIDLPMFLIGADPATGNAVDDPRLRWNDSWAFLRQVLWNPDRQLVLGRRWLRTDPITGVPGIQYAVAAAQLINDLPSSMTGRTRSTFTAQLELAHPFFYGPAQAFSLPINTPVSVVNAGDYTAWSKNLYVDLRGRLVTPTVTVTTSAGAACKFTYQGTVAAGELVTLDVGAFVALATTDPALFGDITKTAFSPSSQPRSQRTGFIAHSGTRPWLALARGANTVRLTAAAGSTGVARLRFSPPYV